MKRIIGPLTAVGLLLVFTLTFSFGENDSVPLTGTWIGEMELPGSPHPVHLTMVILRNSDDVSLKISDALGMIQNVASGRIQIARDSLEFPYMLPDGGGEYEWIRIELRRQGKSLVGQWEDEDGNLASVKFKYLKKA